MLMQPHRLGLATVEEDPGLQWGQRGWGMGKDSSSLWFANVNTLG